MDLILELIYVGISLGKINPIYIFQIQKTSYKLEFALKNVLIKM